LRRLITIVGPDGAGKSAITDALVEELAQRGTVVRFHHRLRRPHQPSTETVTDPQNQVPYGRLTSIAKILYLYLDWIRGWYRFGRPVVRDHGWIIVERGWWDLLVDPARYRLQPTAWLVRFLGRERPGDDLLVVLNAPAEVLRARKQELSVEEIDRQLRLWRGVVEAEGGAIVNVDRPVAAIVESVLGLLGVVPAPAPTPVGEVSERRWISASTSKHHWILPATPPGAAFTALSIHQPIRRRAQMAWTSARVAASAGGFLALPSCPPPALLDVLAPHIPPGGTVAVAERKVGSRAIALIIARDGSPAALVKLVTSDADIEKLAREVAALERYRPLLQAPLGAPRLYHADRGIAVFEPIRWKLRTQPWHLDPAVARALGQFHAAGADATGGLAHGDVAPWNLMRTAAGWCLIDWEDAGDGHPPFYDVFHFLALSQSLLDRPDRATVDAGVHHLTGWVGAAIRAYAEGAGIGTDDVPERFDEFLVRIREGDVDRNSLGWPAAQAGHGPDTIR
jgi:thymidylate kinase